MSERNKQSLLILGNYAWAWLKMLFANKNEVLFNPRYLFNRLTFDFDFSYVDVFSFL